MKLSDAMEKATKGPLHVQDNGNGGCIYITGDHAEDGDVCDLYHKTAQDGIIFRKHNCEANAALLAHCFNHGPKLLEALVAALGNSVDDSLYVWCQIAEAIEAASEVKGI